MGRGKSLIRLSNRTHPGESLEGSPAKAKDYVHWPGSLMLSVFH
jgi:hypothetical protein